MVDEGASERHRIVCYTDYSIERLKCLVQFALEVF